MMTLFDEVNELGNGSYDKWFERYFKKYDLEKIKEFLGDGFKVEYHSTYSKNVFTGKDFITNKQIHITW